MGALTRFGPINYFTFIFLDTKIVLGVLGDFSRIRRVVVLGVLGELLYRVSSRIYP